MKKQRKETKKDHLTAFKIAALQFMIILAISACALVAWLIIWFFISSLITQWQWYELATYLEPHLKAIL